MLISRHSLTRSQLSVLEFIVGFCWRTGNRPTVPEITSYCKEAKVAEGRSALEALIAKGYLKRAHKGVIVQRKGWQVINRSETDDR